VSVLSSRGIILQEPRDFTVQILYRPNLTVLGTGVLISADGIVITCRHIFAPSGRSPSTDQEITQLPLCVRFPPRVAGTSSTHQVTIAAQTAQYEDDLVCLRVQNPPALANRNVAKLGSGADSALHEFRSYGYRQLDQYQASYADGVIVGTIDMPTDRRLRLEPVQLRSQNIDLGMSGAGVLDTEKNLVVGLISETWHSGSSAKDRDTAWAVDAQFVAFCGLDVPLHTALPLRSAERPARPVRSNRLQPYAPVHLDHAPEPMREWVGRGDLLGALGGTWQDEERPLVVGLVGFGGEGKTSVVRRFVDSLLEGGDDELSGVFWWQFSESAGPDEFLAAALEYLTKDRLIAASISGPARAEVAASLLEKGRYLFVLDGLEAVQHQSDDQYGAMADPDLLAFLRFAAVPGHNSLCLLTSRAPVFDLLPYVTYLHMDVDALSVDAGRALLRRLGVFGSDAAIDQVVEDWGRHALSLSLLASYLLRRHDGDVRRVTVLPPLDPSKSRDEMAARILREYDSCLSAQERRFLVAFSVFRAPLAPDALDLLGIAVTTTGPQHADRQISTLLNHLTATRIVRKDASGRLAMHPLVRDYYAHQGTADPVAWAALHEAAKQHYLALMGPDVQQPSLTDLEPAIEAAHHACLSGAFDEAGDIIYEQLYQGERGLITRELNAYSTLLSVFQDFFPNQQVHRAPLVQDAEARSWVLHETATALQMLGRLDESANLLRRAMEEFKERAQWHDAAVSCQNLAELHLELGALTEGARIIAEAFDLAERSADREDELVAHTLQGGLSHLQGQSDAAQESFDAALAIARDFTPLPILYSTSGLHYADHLRRTGRPSEALAAHEANLTVCVEAGWQADEARCRVGLGDLALAANDHDRALSEYDRAGSIARRLTRRDALIHALIGKARYLVYTEPGSEPSELQQAITMARSGGYRVLETDARVLMARSQISRDPESAWESATHVDQASRNLGYHWGHVDAEAVLRDISQERD
jgi:tetratricopeptide (TPR) repeat protein